MDIPTSVNDVLKKANDGASAALGEAISELLNSEWTKLQEALTAEGIPPVVSISFSPNHDLFIEVLSKYIKFDDSDEVMGSLDNMNMVASVYNTVNPETGEEECAIDMDYYYGDDEFAPALYNGRELRDGEKIKHFDHIPTTIDIIKMCIELATGTPLFDIDKNAPFYDDVAQFLGEDDGSGGGEDDAAPTPGDDIAMPPRISGRGISVVRGESGGGEDDAEEELPDECKGCVPKEKCPTCEGRENCAYPCYDPDGPKDEEAGGDDELPVEAAE